MLNIYSKSLDALQKVIFAFLAVLLSSMTLIMLYQVVLRYIFNNANIWAEELVKFMFIWAVMLASCIAIRKDVHLKVDIVINMLKPKTRAISQVIAYIVIFVFLCVLLVLGIQLVMNTMANKSAGLRIPMAIPYLSIPIGTILMMLATIEFIGRNVEIIRNNKENADKKGEITE